MEIKTGMISGALSSCYLKTNKTSVICCIYLEQKGETEPQTEVHFSEGLPLQIRSGVSSIVKSLFSTKTRSTRIKVTFHAVRCGEDLFSCLVNSFSVCAILSGIGIIDTICSSTVYADKNNISLTSQLNSFPLHMVYMIHKKRIMQVHFDGCLDSSLFVKATERLVQTCVEQADMLRLTIEEITRTG
ncbi:uncharacterized protein Eint_021380 [Encephalitozoon intestinalis ATCC 50506]|uniref:Uncharacterized protein n=1 Tax=Encephalitozoon intestinalis (strain ATCC 50506) TaxID=876142 RepID=E0S600_ENCIT|nr:uncharacterized protein Eint_021380 [Encephalitozoon intestinalis ATCC 50506]ADM11135.1 hypothetical protein Eint_021380 [Encephalitozoon intestinalis ATCC 50506]UTX44790.1 exosome complex exonuclease Rrp41 [Encephalitozoon intestinalis]